MLKVLKLSSYLMNQFMFYSNEKKNHHTVHVIRKYDINLFWYEIYASNILNKFLFILNKICFNAILNITHCRKMVVFHLSALHFEIIFYGKDKINISRSRDFDLHLLIKCLSIKLEQVDKSQITLLHPMYNYISKLSSASFYFSIS